MSDSIDNPENTSVRSAPTHLPPLGGLVPIPDPTTLTNEIVARAVSAAREILQTRLDGNDRAISELSRSTATALSAAVVQVKELYAEMFLGVKGEIRGHADIADQRFLRIDGGLAERDKRADQLALSNQAALAAALAAQKEAAGEAQKSAALAISKSEAATAEAIKQGQTLFQNGLMSLTNQVNDLKSRLDKGEGGRTVSDPATASTLAALAANLASLSSTSERRGGAQMQQKDGSSSMIAVIAAMTGAVGVGIAILAVVLSHPH